MNVRNIVNKLLDLHMFINLNDPDIVALTETWLDERVPNSLISCSKNYFV